jgi:hypothetical protein
MITWLLLLSVLTAPLPEQDLGYLRADQALFLSYSGSANCKSIYDSQEWNCGTLCSNPIVLNTTVVEIVVADDIKGATQLLRNDESKVIVVSFRGTKNPHNLIQDLKFWKSELDWDYQLKESVAKLTEQETIQVDSGIRVHTGFLRMYRGLAGINRAIDIQARTYPDYRIVYTGHSLGGAMANLAAAEIYSTFGYGERISIYTFGQPRIGNQAWINYLQTLPFGNRIYRFANIGDPIVLLPAFWADFRHTVMQVNIDRQGNLTLCLNDGDADKEPCAWKPAEIDPTRHFSYEFGGEC